MENRREVGVRMNEGLTGLFGYRLSLAAAHVKKRKMVPNSCSKNAQAATAVFWLCGERENKRS